MSGLRGIDVNLSAGASRKKLLMNNIHGAIPSRHEQHATDNTATNISSHIKNFLIIFSWSSSSFTSPTPLLIRRLMFYLFGLFKIHFERELFFSLSGFHSSFWCTVEAVVAAWLWSRMAHECWMVRVLAMNFFFYSPRETFPQPNRKRMFNGIFRIRIFGSAS